MKKTKNFTPETLEQTALSIAISYSALMKDQKGRPVWDGCPVWPVARAAAQPSG